MISYDVVDKNIGKVNVSSTNLKNEVIFGYPCSSNSVCTPYEVTLKPGTYVFEVWGAQGGNSNWGKQLAQKGGKGGYSIGAYTVTKEKKVFVFVGGKGTDADSNFVEKLGGFNGGGIGGTDAANAYGSSGGGGGATDIRLFMNDLYSRIIVAGAGGCGDNYYTNLGGFGPSGGGFNGSDGILRKTGTITYGYGGTGGNQTHGGVSYKVRGATDGGFGFGGNGSTKYKANGGGGGGSGWFGGAGGSSSGNHSDPSGVSGNGGGGSGYIGKVKSLKFYGITKQMKSGDEEFESIFGGKETGHEGHGACRITLIERICSINRKQRSFYSHFVCFMILIS